jgi:hypothetical protein
MPRAGFEPETLATKRLQTYALDCAATEIGCYHMPKPIRIHFINLNILFLLFK